MLPYETQGNTGQPNWFKFKFTDIQIHQSSRQPQARNSRPRRCNRRFVNRSCLWSLCGTPKQGGGGSVVCRNAIPLRLPGLPIGLKLRGVPLLPGRFPAGWSQDGTWTARTWASTIPGIFPERNVSFWVIGFLMRDIALS